MFKLFLIFSLALLAFFVQVHSVEGQVTDDISDQLEELKEVVNKSITDTSATLDEEIAQLHEHAATVQEETKTEVEKTLSDFNTELATFSQTALDFGIEIQDCIGQSESELNETVWDAFDSFVSNVTSALEDADKDAVLALTNVKKANDDVAEIEKAIEDCASEEATDNCLDELNTKIKKEIKAVPKTAAEEVDKAKESIQSTITSIDEFAKSAIDEGIAKSTDLLTPMYDCINDKINT